MRLTIRMFIALAAAALVIPGILAARDYRDGVWSGRAERGPFSVEVEIAIAGGRITEVKYVSLPDWETETVKREMTKQILERQSAELDAVTGATISCELIAEAVAQALDRARPEPEAESNPPAESRGDRVILKTTMGEIELELFPDKAPKACENFMGLIGKGYYNGTIFHRVIPNFMIQGGDPTGTGRGGRSLWGAPFEDEFHPELRFDRVGLLAMANSGPNTNGSQFFITVAKTPWLNNRHTIFGRVVSGFGVVEAISRAETEANRPLEEIKIVEALIP